MLSDTCRSILKLTKSDWEEQKPYWSYEDFEKKVRPESEILSGLVYAPFSISLYLCNAMSASVVL
jgi:hypothetical protein